MDCSKIAWQFGTGFATATGAHNNESFMGNTTHDTHTHTAKPKGGYGQAGRRRAFISPEMVGAVSSSALPPKALGAFRSMADPGGYVKTWEHA